MKDIIENLVKIATELDSAGLTVEASRIDNATNNLLKTAQHLGTQGYWIRNSRCYSNCYKQKRASNPKKAAQEVWEECSKEYNKSVNDPYETTWSKYASADDKDFSEDKFESAVKVAFTGYEDAFSSLGVDILSVAQSVDKKNSKLAEKIVEVSDTIFKEALNWGEGWKGLGEAWNKFKQKKAPTTNPENAGIAQNLNTMNPVAPTQPTAQPVPAQSNTLNSWDIQNTQQKARVRPSKEQENYYNRYHERLTKKDKEGNYELSNYNDKQLKAFEQQIVNRQLGLNKIHKAIQQEVAMRQNHRKQNPNEFASPRPNMSNPNSSFGNASFVSQASNSNSKKVFNILNKESE